MRRASTEPLRSKAARPPPHCLRQQNHSEPPANQATQKPVNGGSEVLSPQLVMRKWGSASTRVMGPVMAAAEQSMTIAETETVAVVVTAAAAAAAAAAAVMALALVAVVMAAAAAAAEIGHA